MAAIDPEKRRRWANDWVEARRQQVWAYLGGKCARCGGTTDLEVDHIDPATKSFTVMSNLNRRWEVLLRELAKCQLLCHVCHRKKTVECGETGGGWNKNQTGEIPHGTDSGYTYWGCRCPECVQARREYRYGEREVPPHTKLTEDDVRTIRASALPGDTLASMYRVSPSTISCIRLRKTWRHI